jgi:hypothetical protein
MARRKTNSTHCAKGHEIVKVGRLKNGRCKECAKRWVKNSNLKRMYGIRVSDYEEILKAQNGTCAVCPSTELLRVDHAHDTLKVRGILCHACNVSAGLLKESPKRLRNLALYLEAHGRTD